ncbi:MAG TPA: Flp family type IVb pilin [Roseiarcus sp.]|nr:Flp family type IVb pilin [Roseiarcus sp.]
MQGLTKKFLADNSGATAIEYSILASLVALVIIASLSVIGNKLSTTFNEVAANIH